jgi:hypothetical protein
VASAKDRLLAGGKRCGTLSQLRAHFSINKPGLAAISLTRLDAAALLA